GIVGGIGAPIVVDGATWGVIAVPITATAPIPEGAETRLSVFTELVAMAISNDQARNTVTRLVDEQAALRRVATLVAQQPSPEEVFAAVAEAVGSVLGADASSISVFPDDVAAKVVASWSRGGPSVPVGMSVPLDEDGVLARVFHSAAPARIDAYGQDGASAELVRTLGLRAVVGAPVVVEGTLWGALEAGVGGD